MRKREFLVTVVIGLIVIGIYFYRQNYGSQIIPDWNNTLAAILANTNETFELGNRIKTKDCSVRGPLPDPECTPGAIFEKATATTICVPGYTKTVRNVSAKTKSLVYAEYGISYPQPVGSYEVDHLIPLELGGSNDLANLFPESANPTPGFREKDLVENYLHGEVCAGRAELSAAQKQIANNWVAIYDALTPGELNALRGEAAAWH